jgi:hypothetical protein
MGFNGACRREEPRNLSITDQHWIDLIKKYANLRPKKVTHKRFFLTYRSGCCINSSIGVNSMGKVPKKLEFFLSYQTQNVLRDIVAEGLVHLANHGGDLLTIKRFGGWKSSTVAEGYIEASMQKKIEVAQMLGSKQADSALPGCFTTTTT